MEPQKSIVLPVAVAVVVAAVVFGVGGYLFATSQTGHTITPLPSAQTTPTVKPTTTPAVNSPVASPAASSSPTTETKLNDLIVVTSPKPSGVVTSPLTITGLARGSWYSEAVFPILLLDSTGKEVARTSARAQGEWMTENYVPFTATLTFSKPATATGALVLKKDNPSGLPANEKKLIIPVAF